MRFAHIRRRLRRARGRRLAATTGRLDLCGACGESFVCPVTWSEQGPADWWLVLDGRVRAVERHWTRFSAACSEHGVAPEALATFRASVERERSTNEGSDGSETAGALEVRSLQLRVIWHADRPEIGRVFVFPLSEG